MGEKIPDTPIGHLIIKVGRKRARGPAIVDMAFMAAFIQTWK